MNANEKFQLIHKKHGTSSSSFVGSDDYDYINYVSGVKSKGRGKSTALKKYFMKFAGDKTDVSNKLEENLFQLKRHHLKASKSENKDIDVLNF